MNAPPHHVHLARTWARERRRRARVGQLRLLSIGVAGAALLFFAAGIAGDVLDPSISPLHDPVSRLALGPAFPVFEVGLVLAAIAGLLTAFGLRHGVRSTPMLRAAALAMGVGSVEILLLGVFPTDGTVSPTTLAGFVHLGLSGTGFFLVSLGTILFSYAVADDRHWASSKGALQFLAWLGMWVAACFGTLVGAEQVYQATGIRFYTGLAERLLIGVIAGWLLLATRELRRVAAIPSHVAEQDGDVVVE